MRGFLLLFRRDLEQRRMLFVASLAMGLFIAAIPLLRGSRLSPAELRGAAGLTAALVWCAVLAILLGGSIFTRDLTEHRLAFDFRLPVRPGAIWAARLLAAIATIALSAALLLAPSALAGMDWTGAAAGLDEWLGHGAHGALAYSPLAILALLLLAHPIALASRTRTLWAGVDMLAVALVAVAAYWSWDALGQWGAYGAIWRSVRVLTCIAFFGGAIASLLQLVRGRSEPDKAQRLLSLALLTTAITGATAVLGLAHWTLRPQLEDLIGNASDAQSLGPDWVGLQGATRRAPSVRSRFLVAPASGRVLRLGPLAWNAGNRRSIAASIDDSTIAWLESDGESGSLRFFRLSTGAKEPVPQATPTSISVRSINWVLSPNGAFVAALEMLGKETDPMRLVVSRLATGEVVASLQIPHCRVYGDMLFANDNEVIIPCGFPAVTDLVTDITRVVRVDLVSRTSRDERYDATLPPALDASLGLVRTPSGWLKLEDTRPNPESGQRGPNYGLQTAWRLRDSDSDRLLAELTPPSLVSGDAWVHGCELRNGTFAIATGESRDNRLAVYAADGALLRTISLGGGLSTIFAESSDSETILIGIYTRAWNGPGKFSFATIDIGNGTVLALEKRLHPAGWLGEIGSTHSVFRNGSGRLLWFNPQSKALEPLLAEAQYFEEGLPAGSSS